MMTWILMMRTIKLLYSISFRVVWDISLKQLRAVYWLSYFSDKELCTTARYLDLVCADYVTMGYWFCHLTHKELCTTAKWLDLVCADYVVRWYMISQDLFWSHSAIHCSCLLL